MQSKITLQLTFNFGDQLNNDLIPKLLLKKLLMKPCAALHVSIHAHLIDRLIRLIIQCIILIFFSMLQNLQRWECVPFFICFSHFS